MKLFYYDLETTGTKFWKNGIHQISGCIEIDGEVKEDFNFKVQPNPQCEIEEDALRVGGVTKEQILEYPSMSQTYTAIISILSKYVDKYDKRDKFWLIGYNNAGFDDQFFRAFFVQNGDVYFGSWFLYPPLDVAVLAGQYLQDRRFDMVDFKLKTVAATIGLEVDESKLHDASYDIMLTRAIYKKVTEPITAPITSELP